MLWYSQTVKKQAKNRPKCSETGQTVASSPCLIQKISTQTPSNVDKLMVIRSNIDIYRKNNAGCSLD